ncbi:MAG: thiamine pyrophosphate-requiring protein [Hyphomicrobiales bacterium]|nr:thiamine pyrophosphate-requiring protein [Hyphomicrobiales bacterium]
MSGAPTESTAEAYLRRLAERGVEYVFANPGTDFAPIVEALSRRGDYPRFISVPHENVAMAMAHGYSRVSGKPAVVMVHVTVGTANAICGLMNAARDHVPILLAAGRTPTTESGHIASRNSHIHWGQEVFDQGGMARELVKWDYELRAGQPVAAVVDRALDIATSAPRGPVYLTLPREVLADPAVPARRARRLSVAAMPPVPSASEIAAVADVIARAEFPLIVTSWAGRDPRAFIALLTLADTFALPVVQSVPNELNLPSDHAMNLGFEPGALLPEADVVLVIDSAVPWIPKSVSPRRDAQVIHFAADPLVSRYPFRAFEADRLIAGNTAAALEMLRAALSERCGAVEVAHRRDVLAARRADMLARRRSLLATARNQTPIHPVWLTSCLNEVKARNAIVVNELGLNVAHLALVEQGSYIGGNMSGGLGFGLGAALGAKLAAPEREVITVVGDGSYLFGNPLSYHFVARAEGLPTLTVVANNHAWHAVRNATLSVYPDGEAARCNVMPLTELKPSPSFEKAIDVCGGYGERVERPEDLPAALDRGIAAVRAGSPALINVLTRGRH